MKRLIVFLSVLLFLGFLTAQANAGEILRNSPTGIVPFSQYPNITSSYKVALEVYNPANTNTSPSTGIVALRFDATEISGGTVTAPYTVTFTFPDGDATFAVAGGNYVWVLVDKLPVAGVLPAGTNLYAASAPGAQGSQISLSSGRVYNVPSLPLPAGTALYLVQAVWNDTNGDGLVGVGELSNATNVTTTLMRQPADCSTSPRWRLSATISGANGNIAFPIVSFAYVTPQFTIGTYPAANSLDAELDSDTDFQTFISNSGPNVNPPTNIYAVNGANGFFVVQDGALTDSQNWVAWTTTFNTKISFDLASAVPESNVTSITFAGQTCTESTTNPDKVWHCEATSTTYDYDLSLTVNGTFSNDPTVWTLSNLQVGMCSDKFAGTVGAWYGGVEAIVPFVKYSSAENAQTYIKFFNRRDKEVPVYAKAMLMDSNPIVTSINKIATIPANGSITLTADQLKTLLPELAGYDMSKGVPIKFLFRVPTQSTYSTISGTVNLTTGALSATDKSINPYDPYIDGIVVSTYGGQQRTVPLKFKAFKQGNYNE